MTTEQPDPLIDFSHAKEPPRSLDIDKAQEADPIEPEEVSGQSKQNPTPDDLNREDEDPRIGGSQIISGNISAG
ncbi:MULTISPECIES: hypothetical protein [unclassified Nostoc]|uniref:hypothetical protein n=1 Tax=unclassified Nostoc TaxID=2593658 RepID=UPI000B95B3A6|nr:MULTISPECIES: hypothetical protein [unclassified Nostoc]MDZ7950872.1 hypothetical protein [Nostoc sp. DedQUE09]MDZ8086943.1 hypothetical protein [Nostoc sp. DedQUE12b]OYD90630.1 hypothetical protein CDG76_30885 [Nostoc sp. 'Peltigera membranacea cyanobiont' 210A]